MGAGTGDSARKDSSMRGVGITRATGGWTFGLMLAVWAASPLQVVASEPVAGPDDGVVRISKPQEGSVRIRKGPVVRAQNADILPATCQADGSPMALPGASYGLPGGCPSGHCHGHGGMHYGHDTTAGDWYYGPGRPRGNFTAGLLHGHHCDDGCYEYYHDCTGNDMLNYVKCKFGFLIPTGNGGQGTPFIGKYARVYPQDVYYHDGRDGQLWGAAGYGTPVAVPLAPVVGHQFNYSWGTPSSRLTPISRVAP
jgi:hypothetical protein